MVNKYMGRLGYVALLSVVALSLTTTAFAQGKGRGGGGGQGAGGGGGLGNASGRSNGRSDTGLGTASNRSNGRSDEGSDRARLASDNLRNANEDLRDHPGIANTLHVNANDLRAGYQTALITNPNLKFGQYVAATRLAQNLGARFPNITRDAILAGLASGDSLGKTLHNLGLSSQEASDAKKRAEREIKQSRK